MTSRRAHQHAHALREALDACGMRWLVLVGCLRKRIFLNDASLLFSFLNLSLSTFTQKALSNSSSFSLYPSLCLPKILVTLTVDGTLQEPGGEGGAPRPADRLAIDDGRDGESRKRSVVGDRVFGRRDECRRSRATSLQDLLLRAGEKRGLSCFFFRGRKNRE